MCKMEISGLSSPLSLPKLSKILGHLALREAFLSSRLFMVFTLRLFACTPTRRMPSNSDSSRPNKVAALPGTM